MNTAHPSPLIDHAARSLYDAARPPKRLTPSGWAEKHRYLPSSVSAEPGWWRNDRVPYLKGIMDALVEPGVEVVVFLKPTQVGFSEATRNLIGYWIDQDPGPCLLVMPNQQSARDAFEERIKPLIAETPRLAAHASRRPADNKLSVINLDTMTIYTGWAGSAQSLASRPCRYLICDEVDKYPPFAGREADPIALAFKRLETYLHRSRTMIGSTPTTRDGSIWRQWERCGDQRHYWVPCPHCGGYQRLVWPQVKWPKPESDRVRAAEAIAAGDLAWYECVHCLKQIRDRHKPKMLRLGRWVGSDQVVRPDGVVVGEKRVTRQVGFHLNAIYSPWVKFSKLAGEFLKARGSPADMMDFRNSRLAEPFEVQLASTKPGLIRDKALRAGEPGVVPPWCCLLLATADTQKDHFYYVVRAWGPKYRTALVACGVAVSFEQLKAECLDRSFPMEVTGELVSPQALYIDIQGHRTAQVYDFALSEPARVAPLQGASRETGKAYSVNKQPNGLMLTTLRTHLFKDMLSQLIHDEDTSRWMPHKDVGDDYCRQMASEHKVFDRAKRRELWRPVSSGAANHYWDCEVYQVGAAFINQAALFDETDAAQAPPPLTPPTAGPGWATGYKGRY
ncbi:MAG: terminase gpA endonuclease subunit [Mycobacterium sp.]